MSRAVALHDRGVGRMLDGHVFRTEAEGRAWMAQGWRPAENGFTLWEVEASDAPCRSCGHPLGLRVTKWIKNLTASGDRKVDKT